MVRLLPRAFYLCLLCVLLLSAANAFAKRITPAVPSAETSGARLSLRSRRLEVRPPRRHARSRSDFSTASCSRPRSQTWSRQQARNAARHQTRLGVLPRSRPQDALAAHRNRVSAGNLEGIAKGVAVEGHQARRVGHRRAQRQHRAACVLRSLAQQERTRHECAATSARRATVPHSSPQAATPRTARSSSPTTTGQAMRTVNAGR